jgi:DNA-binding NarL/FixJ family response regulator
MSTDPPPDLEVALVTIEGHTYALLSHPLDVASLPLPTAIAALPAALAHVASLAVDGLDNAAIARARGTSVRTVAKQLETLYRRLGIGSRIELAALCSPRISDERVR